MKILHTADWHLGKKLDHVSRLPEQREVLQEICEIAEREAVDAVIIAGDLFDNANPSIEAIELFYMTLKRLSDEGRRPVIGIAGNHDSPDRIQAPDPLARASGIILIGYPQSTIKPFELDTGLRVLQSLPGFLSLKLPNSPTPLRILHTPYANEMRLRKALNSENPEEDLRNVLQAHWQELANTYCDNKGINLLLSHVYLIAREGERPEESEDEKPILTVGGLQEIYTENLPSNLDYVALGHLHRFQHISREPYPVVYSGSPLAYSMSEAEQQKYILILEAEPGQSIAARPLPLQGGKPLIRKTFDEIPKALVWLEANPHCWVELTLISKEFLKAEDRRALFKAHEGIITIVPQIQDDTSQVNADFDINLQQSMEALFSDYFKSKKGQAPASDLLELFKEVLAEKGS